MRLARQVAAATAAWIVMGAVIVSGQVLKQMPASALVLMRVNNLDASSKKVADLATSLGIVQMVPDMADPLSAVMKKIGVAEGVNRAGDLAMAYIDPDALKTPDDKSVLMLLPVSDYQKFVGNFPDATADGDLTQVHFKNDPDITYLAHWGDYVAASPARAIVAKPPTDIFSADGLAAKELDGKDFVVLANLKALRPKMIQWISDFRQKAPADIDQAIQSGLRLQNLDPTKFAPIAKVAVNQLLNLAQQFADGADAATYSVNLSPDGIASTLMCQFEEGSAIGNKLSEVKNTDESMLGGLAEGKYLLFGGATQANFSKQINDFLTPIQTSINDLGPTYAPANAWITAMEKFIAASQSMTFGLMMPSGMPGQAALLQSVEIRHGDAKTLQDSAHQACDAEPGVFQAMGAGQSAPTYVPAAKTVDGVSFDEIKSSINVGNSPQQMQIQQLMMMIYGPQGPSVFLGIINDQTLLTVMGLDDAAISNAITAAKSGDDPLAKESTVKSVAAQLPAQRFAAFYVPLDLWASTGLGYAKMFGIDMGVTLPENLPPLGATISTDGPAIRADSYMPSQLLQALAAAGMQVYLKTQNTGQGQPPAAAPGNNNGGAAPGGL